MARKRFPQVVLTENERAVLGRIAETGNRYEVARSRLFLLADKGVSLDEIAETVGLSHRRARYWLRRFIQDRLGTFGDHLLDKVQVIPPGEDEKKKRERARRKAAKSQARAKTPRVTEPAEPVVQPSTKALAEVPVIEALDIVLDEPAAGLDQPPGASDVIEVVMPLPPGLENEALPELPPIPGVDKPRRALRLDAAPGVDADDPMSEAGRKVLFYHFERMLLHEPGARLGEDIEALHDMRVATRRMRAAFRVFGAFYKPKVTATFVKGLRAAGRALGVVRDLDVFMEKVAWYQDALPEDERAGMAPLLEAWQKRREEARLRLARYLDGGRFARLVDDFDRFLARPGAGARQFDEDDPPRGYLVRHVAPRLVYERLEVVRSYDLVLDRAPIEALHALRIEFKRFRYTLEFFEEVLGAEGAMVVKEVKAMQDHLGDLNDANVAGQILQTFIAEYEQDQAGVQISERRSIDKIIRYMAWRAAEKHHLMVTFPEVWAHFNRPEVRQALAMAVSAL